MHPLAVIFTPIRATLYPSRQPTPPLPLWWGPENHLEASACRTSLARPRRRASHGYRGDEVCESARKRASENFGLSARKCAKVTLILGPKAAKAAFGQIWPKIAKVTHLSKPYFPPAKKR